MTSENEFRINNWVLIDEDGKWTPVQIKGICIASKTKKIESFSDPFIIHTFGSTVIRYGDDDTEDNFLVKPIPLTPEILEKCGVEKGSIYFHFSNFRIVQLTNPDDWLVLFSNIERRVCVIKYLHQFQNLHFALNNKELTYNP